MQVPPSKKPLIIIFQNPNFITLGEFYHHCLIFLIFQINFGQLVLTEIYRSNLTMIKHFWYTLRVSVVFWSLLSTRATLSLASRSSSSTVCTRISFWSLSSFTKDCKDWSWCWKTNNKKPQSLIYYFFNYSFKKSKLSTLLNQLPFFWLWEWGGETDRWWLKSRANFLSFLNGKKLLANLEYIKVHHLLLTLQQTVSPSHERYILSRN